LICNKKIILNFALFFFLSLYLISPIYADDYKVIRGTVINIIDGDTVIIKPSGGKLFKCRLYGIDTPEIPVDGNPGQPFGRAAERKLTNLVLHTTVHATLTGDWSFGREICIVRRNGVDINREMIKHGYAWSYREFLKGPYISEYINAEKEARKMKRGLWVQSNPQPPWDFRARYR